MSDMLQNRADFPHRVRHEENLFITMRDGTRLAARLWLPEDAGEQPGPGSAGIHSLSQSAT